jgi:regulator of sirC expression with transglutaminase-like and TPR domain
LNEVLDDREGLPITLAILFIELGHRIGLKELVGVPIPAHFMVKYSPEKEDAELIDVFNEGKTVSRDEVDEIAQEATGSPLNEAHLKAARKREIIIRMLRNLHSIAQSNESGPDSLRYLDLIIAIAPEPALDHLDRARLRLQLGDRAGARQDFKWLLDNNPPGIDTDRIAELMKSL